MKTAYFAKSLVKNLALCFFVCCRCRRISSGVKKLSNRENSFKFSINKLYIK